MGAPTAGRGTEKERGFDARKSLTALPSSALALWPALQWKTTLATALREHFRRQNRPVILLDGDELRSKLYADLGFASRPLASPYVSHT